MSWSKYFKYFPATEKGQTAMLNDDLMYSAEYAEYIMENCNGDRIICNGDTLTDAMEDEYLFDEFVASIGEQE